MSFTSRLPSSRFLNTQRSAQFGRNLHKFTFSFQHIAIQGSEMEHFMVWTSSSKRVLLRFWGKRKSATWFRYFPTPLLCLLRSLTINFISIIQKTTPFQLLGPCLNTILKLFLKYWMRKSSITGSTTCLSTLTKHKATTNMNFCSKYWPTNHLSW